MSDTPRTDAAIERYVEDAGDAAFWDHVENEMRQLERELTTANQRIEGLEEALRFYADARNYESDEKGAMSYAIFDAGEKARQALQSEVDDEG